MLDKYIYYNSLMDHTDGKLLVGLNNAIINTKWVIVYYKIIKFYKYWAIKDLIVYLLWAT